MRSHLPRVHGTWHGTHQPWGKMHCGILHWSKSLREGGLLEIKNKGEPSGSCKVAETLLACLISARNIRLWDDHTSRLTESTSHLVPVMTKPGSRVSPWASSSPCPALYTCVPMQRSFLLPIVTVVSMGTALFSMGLEAEDKHWIFPQIASLVGTKRECCVIENDQCWSTAP